VCRYRGSSSSGRQNPVGAEADRGTKLNGRINQAEIQWINGRDRSTDEIRQTMWIERDRADEIDRQKRAGEMERMK
jgi:hypothetical protein